MVSIQFAQNAVFQSSGRLKPARQDHSGGEGNPEFRLSVHWLPQKILTHCWLFKLYLPVTSHLIFKVNLKLVK